jgi:hypothetical protein
MNKRQGRALIFTLFLLPRMVGEVSAEAASVNRLRLAISNPDG